MVPITATFHSAPPHAGAGSRTVVFTTPNNYAPRLSQLLSLNSFTPIWCPTVTVETTPETLASLRLTLSPPNLEYFSAITFTSRTGITAFTAAVSGIDSPLLAPAGDEFTVAALGKDAELLNPEFLSKICSNLGRIRTLIPCIATPSGIAEALGVGRRRKVLCPVPVVFGMDEPPVVPNFVREMELSGWEVVRVGAYKTQWAGPRCAEWLVNRGDREVIDAVVFTSTAEVEGLLRSLREFGWDWGMVRRMWRGLVVAAHGPVTAAGAERLGVRVDVVSSNFDSFQGVVDALASKWEDT